MPHDVNMHARRGDLHAERTLLIYNIPPNASKEDVHKLFSFDFETYINTTDVGDDNTKSAYLTFCSMQKCNAAYGLSQTGSQEHIIEGRLLVIVRASDEYIVPADSGFASEDEQDEEEEEDEDMQDGQDDEDDNMNDGQDDEDDNVEDNKDKNDVYEEYGNQTDDVDMLDTTSGDEENYYSENDGYSSPSDDED
ncbi:hypothetical protein ACET3Z_026966 [Daucus carota]